MKHNFPLILFFVIVLLAGCRTMDTSSIEDVSYIDSTEIKAAMKRTADSTFAAFYLQEHIASITSEIYHLIEEQEIYSDNMLPQLYESHGYQLLWDDAVNQAKALNAIKASVDDGLIPHDYHHEKIEELIAAKDSSFSKKTALDILITDAIILYGTHLLNGKLDPNSHEPDLKFESRVLAQETLLGLRQNLIDGDVNQVIDFLRPHSRYYSGMRKGLQHYTLIADSGGWDAIDFKDKKIDTSSTHDLIPKIRQRLIKEGDLIFEADSLTYDSLLNSTFYDTLLIHAVKNFQLRHGLNTDGVIGKGTMKALNISVEEKVKLLRANLERARWIYHDLPDDYILVNIAGFDLRLVKADTLAWETRVVAGKVADATPIFKDKMEYIVLNPTWTVPSSISNDEILPKLKKDSTYLKRNGMKLYSHSGKIQDHEKIDFSNIQKGDFPYIVKQNPGSYNSLGRVKFMFPNKHFIYLHDTPSRSHFWRQERAFSHGCIRVKDPLKLTEHILKEQLVERTFIDSIISSGKTKRINLEEELEVLITYFTAFSDGEITYFFNDVYKRDGALYEELGL